MRMSLFRILDRHSDFDVRTFLDGALDISESLYRDLYELYFDEMPYGVAKAREGDPHIWVAERLTEELQGA
jgi:hypothetical protein